MRLARDLAAIVAVLWLSPALADGPTPGTPLRIINGVRATGQSITLAPLDIGAAALDGTGHVPVSQLPALTGDITSSAGSASTTLATVNSSPGAVGGASLVPVLTVDGKGRVTSSSSAAVVAPAGTLTGSALAAGITSAPGLGATPSVSAGLTAKPGTATTYMRSDAAPAISQAITPQWTALHTFNAGMALNGANGTARQLSYATNNVGRWNLGVQDSESGSGNSGSNLFLAAYDDSGNFLGFALHAARATQIVDFSFRPTVAGSQVALLSDLSGSTYLGAWNASTNTPTLTTTPSAAGSFYTVSVAGTQSITGSSTAFSVGDQVRSNGTAWQRIPNVQAVTSVAGRTGAISLSSGDVSGLGALATQSAVTNAQLPQPTTSALGGVQAATAAAHNFSTGINTSGVLTFAQPAFSDLSGTATVQQGGTGATGLTGLIKGNGSSAFSAAVAGTDYLAPTGSGAALTGITASQVGAVAKTGDTMTGALSTPSAVLSGSLALNTTNNGSLNTGNIEASQLGNMVSFCPQLSCVYTSSDNSAPNSSFFDHQRAGHLISTATSDDGHSEEQALAVLLTVGTGAFKDYTPNTGYNVGDNIEIGNAVYRACATNAPCAAGTTSTPAGTTGPSTTLPGARPTTAQGGQYMIHDGSVWWLWINDAAINAKVGIYDELRATDGAGGTWGQSINVLWDSSTAARFYADIELDQGNNGPDCTLGSCQAYGIFMPRGGVNTHTGAPQGKMTAGIYLAGGASSPNFSDYYGIIMQGRLGSTSGFEDNTTGGQFSIGVCADGASPGGCTHTNADIQIGASSIPSMGPVGLSIVGPHSSASIGDSSTVPATLHISGTKSLAGIYDQEAAPDGIALLGTYTNHQIYGTGWGVSPAGGLIAASYSVGATAGVSCSGTPSSSFATSNGIVTHC